ncbi:hypothetical protein J6590_089965, partial [Homalodisca vitripennis]
TSSLSSEDTGQAAHPMRTIDKQPILCGHWTSSSSYAENRQAAHPLRTIYKQPIPCGHWTSSSSPAGTGQAAHTLRTLDNQLHQKVFTDQLQVHLKSFETTSANDIEFQLHRFCMWVPEDPQLSRDKVLPVNFTLLAGGDVIYPSYDDPAAPGRRVESTCSYSLENSHESPRA